MAVAAAGITHYACAHAAQPLPVQACPRPLETVARHCRPSTRTSVAARPLLLLPLLPPVRLALLLRLLLLRRPRAAARAAPQRRRGWRPRRLLEHKRHVERAGLGQAGVTVAREPGGKMLEPLAQVGLQRVGKC